MDESNNKQGLGYRTISAANVEPAVILEPAP